jgi:DNA-binding transcriptional regulator YbjK
MTSTEPSPTRPNRAARDPVGRRRTILEAAVRCIAEVGSGDVTHRLIAARAGVPLGSTTYYFPSLPALVAAALEDVAATTRADVDRWRARLDTAADPEGTLVDLLQDYLADRSRAVLECELYLAAARDEQLRPAARIWIDGLRDVFAARFGPASAGPLAALVDGMLLQALVTGEELDGAAVAASIRGLVGSA